MNEFWYVYKEFGGVPRYEHNTFTSALEEAKRLVVSTGGRYFVLKAEAIVDVSPGITYLLASTPPQSPYIAPITSDDDIPF